MKSTVLNSYELINSLVKANKLSDLITISEFRELLKQSSDDTVKGFDEVMKHNKTVDNPKSKDSVNESIDKLSTLITQYTNKKEEGNTDIQNLISEIAVAVDSLNKITDSVNKALNTNYEKFNFLGLDSVQQLLELNNKRDGMDEVVLTLFERLNGLKISDDSNYTLATISDAVREGKAEISNILKVCTDIALRDKKLSLELVPVDGKFLGRGEYKENTISLPEPRTQKVSNVEKEDKEESSFDLTKRFSKLTTKGVDSFTPLKLAMAAGFSKITKAIQGLKDGKAPDFLNTVLLGLGATLVASLFSEKGRSFWKSLLDHVTDAITDGFKKVGTVLFDFSKKVATDLGQLAGVVKDVKVKDPVTGKMFTTKLDTFSLNLSKWFTGFKNGTVDMAENFAKRYSYTGDNVKDAIIQSIRDEVKETGQTQGYTVGTQTTKPIVVINGKEYQAESVTKEGGKIGYTVVMGDNDVRTISANTEKDYKNIQKLEKSFPNAYRDSLLQKTGTDSMLEAEKIYYLNEASKNLRNIVGKRLNDLLKDAEKAIPQIYSDVLLSQDSVKLSPDFTLQVVNKILPELKKKDGKANFEKIISSTIASQYVNLDYSVRYDSDNDKHTRLFRLNAPFFDTEVEAKRHYLTKTEAKPQFTPEIQQMVDSVQKILDFAKSKLPNEQNTQNNTVPQIVPTKEHKKTINGEDVKGYYPSSDREIFVKRLDRAYYDAGVVRDDVRQFLVAQDSMETNFGKSVIGNYNYGNIKDFSGSGRSAYDKTEGRSDKYKNFESELEYAKAKIKLLAKKSWGVDIDKDAPNDIIRKIEGTENNAYATIFSKAAQKSIETGKMLPNVLRGEKDTVERYIDLGINNISDARIKRLGEVLKPFTDMVAKYTDMPNKANTTNYVEQVKPHTEAIQKNTDAIKSNVETVKKNTTQIADAYKGFAGLIERLQDSFSKSKEEIDEYLRKNTSYEDFYAKYKSVAKERGEKVLSFEDVLMKENFNLSVSRLREKFNIPQETKTTFTKVTSTNELKKETMPTPVIVEDLQQQKKKEAEELTNAPITNNNVANNNSMTVINNYGSIPNMGR